MKPPRGLHQDRLKPQAENPREVAFIKQWEKENGYVDILDRLLTVPCQKDDEGAFQPFMYPTFWQRRPFGATTERDRIVAATVIQWLGSNVGLDFVGQALEKAGYEYPKKKKNDTDH